LYLFGFIPLRQEPTTPPLREVFLLLKTDGEWKTLRLVVNPSQQTKTKPIPSSRWIDLGTVQVFPEKLTPVKFKEDPGLKP
jgi:hypothetical protein